MCQIHIWTIDMSVCCTFLCKRLNTCWFVGHAPLKHNIPFNQQFYQNISGNVLISMWLHNFRNNFLLLSVQQWAICEKSYRMHRSIVWNIHNNVANVLHFCVDSFMFMLHRLIQYMDCCCCWWPSCAHFYSRFASNFVIPFLTVWKTCKCHFTTQHYFDLV